MGRPKGDGARSKSRPSSSSLAASLLPQGATTVGFGGFVGSSRVESSLPSEDAAPFLDVDSEVAQHLKRLARKDPTTKLKALTSLSQLFKQKTAKEIVPIIPQWAFEYKKLLLDYNREVRKATHETMTNLFNVVGRDLAPHLKSLMGPWWLSQFDSAIEVSQAAKRSFQGAFPTHEKRQDVLILCISEIFIYIEENLKLTPQSMSDKMTAQDELEEMHRQVISSSLLALATILDIVVSMLSERPVSESESKRVMKARGIAISYAEKLFSAQKYFLEFFKSQSPAIRSAVYSVIRSYIKNVPSVINETNIKNLAPVILGAFQEKEPLCHSSMWEMILLFSKTFPNSWTNLNVQKNVLNRFWQFLKSGCFGSQQASYPALILFLDVIPPKVVVGQKFLLEFFQNLWAGKGFCHSSIDRQALFHAIRECLLWVFRNASRYCDKEGAISNFHGSLTDQILLKLLWHDYLLFENSKDKDESSSDSSFNQGSTLVLNTNSSVGYLQDLGNCIIEILSGINSLEHNMLLLFSSAFQETCLGIFQLPESSIKDVEQIKRVTEFLLLLDQQVVRKGESWPFSDLVGPTLVKCFPLIKKHDSPYAVRFMVASVYIFGPHKIVEELLCTKLGKEEFLHAFNETFIPWCLLDHSPSIGSRLDLILALLDDQCFSEQWDSIIVHATNLEQLKSTDKNLDFDNISVLAMLLEKARERSQSICYLQGSCAAHWHHKLLDSTAIAVAREFPSFGAGSARFVCAALGGLVGDGGTSFLSRDATIIIFEEILRKLMIFVKDSSFTWVKDAYSLITIKQNESEMGFESSINVLDMAQFALEVLDVSFFWLKLLADEVWLVSGILSTVFVIDWECSLVTVCHDEFGEDNKQNIKTRWSSCKSVNVTRSHIDCQFLRSLGTSIQNNLENILIQSVRNAVLKEDKLDLEKITSLCCNWIGELLECLCQEQSEEQKLFDKLLLQSDSWPKWVLPNFNSGERTACLKCENASFNAQASEDHRLVSLIDKLVSKFGFHRFIGGSVLPSCSTELAHTELTTTDSHYSRAWLAAELLCTWNWPSGSALSSFLPSLITYVKSESYSPEDGLLDSIVTILLDGALVRGGSCGPTLCILWPITLDEVDNLAEPFLRAHVSLLLTLFEENIWAKDKAIFYFKLLLTKLYIGETINANCLRILPSIVDVLIRPLSIIFEQDDVIKHPDSSKGSEVQEVLMDWLKRTLLFPPLNVWLTGEDMEDWFHLVMSCYPIRGVRGEKRLSSEEKMLLIELYRKQRLNSGASSSVNKLPVVQILLSKLVLVSVAYCWEEFDEEDWDFALYHLRRWIELAVVMMEEVAENVNDAIAHTSSSSNLEMTLEMLESTVSVRDPIPLKLARNALVGFSLFCEVIELQKKEHKENSHSLIDKWEIVVDRILEGILRLFFSTAAAEAIASSYCAETYSIITSSRLYHSKFWDLVASHVVKSSSHVREKAVKSVEIWGLSKGPVNSLFALLFSPKPLPSLQFAAYVILSTEPVSHLAFGTLRKESSSDEDASNNQDYRSPEPFAEENIHLREEISSKLENFPTEVLEMDLLSSERINVFLAWSLLLSHLVSLPSSSPSREKIVQYIQDSASSTILDCLFQHIPLEFCAPSAVKKKDLELPASVSEAARAATRAITCSSALFALESLWPVGPEKIAMFAGAIFGLILQTLPAYVRGWFGDIRDRSTSSAVEFFTKSYCSPPLIANELSLIKKAKFVDENFSVSVSKSANEIVATYTKDETGMDLVIRLPASYPLRSVDVDCTRSLGISEVKKRKWLMSMMSFVRNQNGALAEAIQIWKSNFDKEFEGVEECPICYSVIHTSNHSLPRLACKTCKHKFHSACLYKWFSTSHKSTCPLCQSPF
nr:E3 ubiquitin-protein ligase listerin [Ipomoea batatas]